ncbi:MAG: histidine kinase, partial [Actinomycetota bacterium]|nr:histidine kinase [Actinomycetota bacterium]
MPRDLPAVKQPRNPISRRRVDAVVSRAIAGFGIVFAAQTAPILLGQLGETGGAWLTVAITALVGSLLITLSFSIARRWVRTAHATFAFIYIATLVSWPFAVVEPIGPEQNHWLYYMLTVATATAAIAFRTRLAVVYLFVVPAIYGFIHALPAGGGASWERSLLDSVYAIILGGAVLIIVTMLREASTSVDVAQATALDRYAVAVRHHATEVERVEVDAIVHDSVLTTLLSAANARTPQAKRIAATMAGNAMGHLRDAARAPSDGPGTITVADVAARIVEASTGFPVPFEVRELTAGGSPVSAAVGETITAAATQAMVNSVQHGGDAASRWLRISDAPEGGMLVEIGDTGPGFDVAGVPTERLGVRVSILERVANAGGVARIDSAPG